jgi:hypothetical protein
VPDIHHANEKEIGSKMTKTTQDERDANETRNIRAVADFRVHWDAKHMKLHTNETGLCFKAQISYENPLRPIVDRTDVRISLSGYGTDGMIDITETRSMTVDDYHLRIFAAFGEYKLNLSSGELIVSNVSAKMGGKYSIRILPIGAPD